MVARSVVDVVLGEATYGTKAQRLADMKAIASVIANRATLTGLSPQQIVANQREFNAYGKALPKGANAYRDLAEQAIREVREQGPVHRGTFYATPSATRNLPKGLEHVTSTTGHRYFSDPQNRAIGTALGYRSLSKLTGAQQAISTAMAPQAAPRSVPTPTFAQRTAPTMAASLARTPASQSAVVAASRLPSSLTAAPAIGGRVGPNTTNGVPTPTMAQRAPDPSRFGAPATQAVARAPDPARFGSPVVTASALGSRVGPNTTTGVPTPSARPAQVTQVAQSAPRAAPDASRFGPNIPAQMPAAMLDRYADTRTTPVAGRLSDRVAPQSVTAGLGRTLTDQQSVNLASRLGTFAPMQAVAGVRSTPAPTARPTLGSVVGITPAAAASLPSAPRTVAQTVTPAMAAPTAPARTNFAGPVGSPRALEGRLNASLTNVNPMVSQAPARPATPSPQARTVAPAVTATPTLATGFAGRIGSPRSVEASLPAGALGGINAPARIATPTAAPRTAALISAPAQVAVPTSRPTINAPQARTVAQAPQARPAPVAAPAARAVVSDPWGGMRQSVPSTRTAVGQVAQAAPAAPQSQGLASRLGLTPGRIAGSVIGSAVAGPIGGLVGGFIGGRIAGPQAAPSVTAAPAAPSSGGLFSGFGGLGGLGGMNTSSSGGYGNNDTRQSGFGNAGGYSDRSGSFAGFGERDSAVGTDGGKVGGSSSSKSSSSGKSSGSSSSGKSGGSSGSSGGKGGKK